MLPSLTRHRKHRQPGRAPQRKNRSREHTVSVWLWLFVGALVGILGVTGLYWLFSQKWSTDSTKRVVEKRTQESASDAKRPLPKKVVEHPVAVKATTSRFEFYQLLPGMEVPIPETHAAIPKTSGTAQVSTKAAMHSGASTTSTATPTLKPSSQPKAPVQATRNFASIETKVASPQYWLQVGAYKTFSPAGELKTRLVNLGFSPRIQKVEAQDGAWFRVMLGPFPSEAMVLKQKSNLAKQKINGILILQRH